MPRLCECGCGLSAPTAPKSLDYANISGEYRRSREDFLELCRPCHKRFDAAAA